MAPGFSPSENHPASHRVQRRESGGLGRSEITIKRQSHHETIRITIQRGTDPEKQLGDS